VLEDFYHYQSRIVKVYTTCAEADITNRVGLLLVRNMIFICVQELEDKKKQQQAMLKNLKQIFLDILPLVTKRIEIIKSSIDGGKCSEVIIMKLSNLGVIFKEVVHKPILTPLLILSGFVECFLTFCHTVCLVPNPGIKHAMFQILKIFASHVGKQLKILSNQVAIDRFVKLTVPLIDLSKRQGEQAFRVTLLLIKHFYTVSNSWSVRESVARSVAVVLAGFCDVHNGRALKSLEKMEDMGEEKNEDVRFMAICLRYLESLHKLPVVDITSEQQEKVNEQVWETCSIFTRSAYQIASTIITFQPI